VRFYRPPAILVPLFILLGAFTVELREVTYLFSHQTLIAIDLYRLQTGAIVSLICIILLLSIFLHNRYLERRRTVIPARQAPAGQEMADNLCRALDFARTPISIHAADFTILKANQAMADHLGLNREEIVGRKCYDILHPGPGQPAECPQRRALGSKKQEVSLLEVQALGGTKKIYCDPVLDPAGKVVRTIHVIREPMDEMDAAPPAEIVQICTSCKVMRDQDGNWRSLEEHLHGRGILLSHGVCGACIDKLYKNCA
jgi:PAS domain-containing protein